MTQEIVIATPACFNYFMHLSCCLQLPPALEILSTQLHVPIDKPFTRILACPIPPQLLADAIGSIHLLPIFPSTGDRGFAPVNYQEVDSKLGERCGSDAATLCTCFVAAGCCGCSCCATACR
jgi:hypothetical protein